MDEMGNLSLTDFGMAKIQENKKNKTNSIVGSPEYISPEII